MKVYAIFFDMEDDVPDAYVLDEQLAKELTVDREIADYVTLEVDEKAWMAWLTSKTKKRE